MCETAVHDRCEKSQGAALRAGRPPGGLTSLDDLETTSHPLEHQNRVQYAFHERSQAEREAVINALWESDDEKHSRRAARLGWCGFSARVYVNADGSTGIYPHRCRDRLCPTCQRFRSCRLRARAEAILATADAPRFVTLTLKHSPDKLTAILSRLRDCFSRLRRARFWRDRVKGGLYGVEVKLNPTTRQWHAHIHCLVDGEYIPQDVLSDEWLRVTGDSQVVDVRAVHSRKQAVRYIAAYVTKASDVAGWQQAEIREFADALHGQRLLQTFGCFHGIPVDDNSDETEPQEAACVLDLWALAMYAESGDASACHLVVALAALDDRAGEILERCLPCFNWSRYSLLCDPLAFVTAWAADPPPEDPTMRPLAIQLHLWS